MNALNAMIGKLVELQISGDIERIGILVDYGLDVVVIFDGIHYIYIPFGHIQNIRLSENLVDPQIESEYARTNPGEEISYRKMLMESKGMFVQIFVSGNQSIHGYVTSVLTNYFMFYSPVHQTLFVPLFHLKWLIPYPENQTPYTLQPQGLPVHPTTYRLARNFDEQIKKMEGKIVVFDLGFDPDKIGLLKSFDDNIIELVTAEQKPVFWNIQHIKVAQCPTL